MSLSGGDNICNLDVNLLGANVSDISVWLDDKLLRRGLNERYSQYYMAKASGSNILDKMDVSDDLLVSAAHVDKHNNINNEHLSKIRHIS